MHRLKLFFLISTVVLVGVLAFQSTDAQVVNPKQLQGITPEQVKGVSPQQVQQIKAKMKGNADAEPANTENPTTEETKTEAIESEDQSQQAKQPGSLAGHTSTGPNVFGADLFNNPNLTFEPNLRIPTPENYQIGPDDEIIISIYGYSQHTYDLTVSGEGSVNIPAVGFVYLNGLTIAEAQKRLKTKLSSIYSGLQTGNTEIKVSLGAIRSIKVTIIGEATQPGTYTLPSLATVFNALYACGGPGQYGGYRNIEVIRDNKVIQTLDVYDFLMSGDQSSNIRLRDQDVIRIPTFKRRVLITGEVKRPGYFDIQSNETLEDLIRYAGGFTKGAYKSRIHVVRLTDKERAVADVSNNHFGIFYPRNGDVYKIGSILDRYKNRVSIAGAVFHPGYFELTEGMTLSELIKKADGLREDAFMPRGHIIRINPDQTSSTISFNVKKIMNGQASDITLKREDAVTITSIFDLSGEANVTIKGAIRNNGSYGFYDGMTIGDLILKAGGFKNGATPNRIEISRRVYNSNDTSATAKMAKVFTVNVDANLQIDDSDFLLQPFDVVNVRMSPGFEIQKQVTIRGQVLYPGSYTIAQKNETLTDLIRRAGGLTIDAYLKGASLKRTFKTDRQMAYNNYLKQQKLNATLAGDSSLSKLDNAILHSNYIGINLDEAIADPGSGADLTLRQGDVLTIPLKNATVRISGDVLYPVTAVYKPNKGFKYYISQAGGFARDAWKGRSFVIYPNGQAKSTKHFLFFKNYPKVEPGSSIYIPQKPPRNPLGTKEILGLSSGAASLALAVLAIINLTK